MISPHDLTRTVFVRLGQMTSFDLFRKVGDGFVWQASREEIEGIWVPRRVNREEKDKRTVREPGSMRVGPFDFVCDLARAASGLNRVTVI